MRVIQTILDKLAKTVSDHQTFRDAQVYQREERVKDPVVEDFKVPSVYLAPLKPKKQDSDFRMRFRTFPIQVTIKLAGHGKGYLHTETDEETVEIYAWECAEALMDLADGYPLTGAEAYHVTLSDDVDMNFKASKELLDHDGEVGQEVRRIQATLIFYSVRNYED